MTKVVKFGGTSLAEAKQFLKVADIIRSDPDRRYVVPSAPGKRFSEIQKLPICSMPATIPHREAAILKRYSRR